MAVLLRCSGPLRCAHSRLSRRLRDFGDHIGCAHIAPSGARVYVGAHRLTELGRPTHGTEVVGWVG
jgi:hypothetical protein